MQKSLKDVEEEEELVRERSEGKIKIKAFKG